MSSEKAQLERDRLAPGGGVLVIPVDALVIVPIRNAVLFPGMILPLTINREQAILAAQQAAKTASQVLHRQTAGVPNSDSSISNLHRARDFPVSGRVVGVVAGRVHGGWSARSGAQQRLDLVHRQHLAGALDLAVHRQRRGARDAGIDDGVHILHFFQLVFQPQRLRGDFRMLAQRDAFRTTAAENLKLDHGL